MGIPARQYGTSLRHELESNIVDMMLTNFRKAHPNIMVLAGKRYEFDPKDTDLVRDWLCSKIVEEQAVTDLRNITCYSAGVARGRRQPASDQASFRLNYTDGTTEEFTVETIEETLEAQYRLVKTLTAENLELRNEVVRLQGLIAAQTIPPLVPAPRQGNVTRLLPRVEPPHHQQTRNATQAVLSKLALFIVLNPNVVYGAKGKTDAAARIADAANAAGLRTPRGREWTQANVYTYHHTLDKMIAAIREEIKMGRLTKPRFRKTTQPMNPFAIAAE